MKKRLLVVWLVICLFLAVVLVQGIDLQEQLMCGGPCPSSGEAPSQIVAPPFQGSFIIPKQCNTNSPSELPSWVGWTDLSANQTLCEAFNFDYDIDMLGDRCCANHQLGALAQRVGGTADAFLCWYDDVADEYVWLNARDEPFDPKEIDCFDQAGWNYGYVSNTEQWFKCDPNGIGNGISSAGLLRLYDRAQASQFICAQMQDSYQFVECCDDSFGDERACSSSDTNLQRSPGDRINLVSDGTSFTMMDIIDIFPDPHNVKLIQAKNWQGMSELEIVFWMDKSYDVYIRLMGDEGIAGERELLFQDKLINYVDNEIGIDQPRWMRATIPIYEWRYVDGFQFYFETLDENQTPNNVFIGKAFLKPTQQSTTDLKYCSGTRYHPGRVPNLWIDDLDNNGLGNEDYEPAGQVACDENGYDWTGTQCCGNDGKETIIDDNGACLDGVFLADGDTMAEVSYSLAYNEGKTVMAPEPLSYSLTLSWTDFYQKEDVVSQPRWSDKCPLPLPTWSNPFPSPLYCYAGQFQGGPWTLSCPSDQHITGFDTDLAGLSQTNSRWQACLYHGSDNVVGCVGNDPPEGWVGMLSGAIWAVFGFSSFSFEDIQDLKNLRSDDFEFLLDLSGGREPIGWFESIGIDVEGGVEWTDDLLDLMLTHSSSPRGGYVSWMSWNTGIWSSTSTRWNGDLILHCGKDVSQTKQISGTIDFTSPRKVEVSEIIGRDWKIGTLITVSPPADPNVQVYFKSKGLGQADSLETWDFNDTLIIRTDVANDESDTREEQDNFVFKCFDNECWLPLVGEPPYTVENLQPDDYDLYFVGGTGEVLIDQRKQFDEKGILQARRVTQKSIYSNGSFYGCQINDSNLVGRDYCDAVGERFCSYDVGWSNEDSGSSVAAERNMTSLASPGANASEEGYVDRNCCAPEDCWSGLECVGNMKYDANLQPINGYACIDGEWEFSPLLHTWDWLGTGYCGYQQCLVNANGNPNLNSDPQSFFTEYPDRPRCIVSEESILDNYCANGTWESRTKQVALELLKLVNKTGDSNDYTLHCDYYNTSLPSSIWSSTDFLNYAEGRFDSQQGDVVCDGLRVGDHCINNFCVMAYNHQTEGRKILLATSSNVPINSSWSILNWLFPGLGRQNYCDSLSGDGTFQKCSNDDNVWYALGLNSIVYTQDGVDMEGLSFFDYIFIWLRDPIQNIIDWITGEEKPNYVQENYDFTERVVKFNRFYNQAKPGKYRVAVVEEVGLNQTILASYYNYTGNVCDYVGNLANGLNIVMNTANSGVFCNQTGNDYRVVISNPNAFGLWASLTNYFPIAG
ncbi:hypothetical protein ACFLZB_01625 [Nanoarchaeota archaeon]